ncbi:putative unusual protein kinase regulating ubiquinone biosynthesis, AarF/ABC1/UbiB family [Nocardia amikacinitolerans]|nr:putative unusual protein kinase regulating ubiquinone biosynthesis, AarF/ABC1/UbiB family [Nocardia amikacinitolerans]
MAIRRRPAPSGTESRGRRLFAVPTDGAPPVRRSVRNAKLAGVPVAFAGRRAVGIGKRALGRSAAEVDREIQLRTAQHIFEVLGELKGCAAKLGQLLAIYELALPPELAEPYRIALSRLQDAAPAMLPSAVDAAMTASMGPDWRWHFREFDERRAAAASIGQVHRAVWRDGTPVAVKVMYPGGRAAVAGDLEQLRRFSALANVFLPGADVEGVLAAITECVLEELDYAAEARYQEAFATAYADDPDIHVPRVIARHGDVLVTEWLDGTPVTRVIESGSRAERDRVGMLMVRFMASAWPRSGLLYGDPHPGNFRVLPDGRLGVVDFGACAVWPPDGFDELAQDCVRAVFRGGPRELEAAARRHGFVESGRAFDADALFSTIAPCTEPLNHDTYRLSTPWLRKHVLRLTNPRLSNIIRQMTMPAYMTPFARSMLTLIGALCQLGTEGPYRAEIARWYPELDEIAHGPTSASPVATATISLLRETDAVQIFLG